MFKTLFLVSVAILLHCVVSEISNKNKVLIHPYDTSQSEFKQRATFRAKVGNGIEKSTDRYSIETEDKTKSAVNTSFLRKRYLQDASLPTNSNQDVLVVQNKNKVKLSRNENIETPGLVVYNNIPGRATDVTSRSGLGESPGVTGLEYLGTGYNILEGNPRGATITELDPGFRRGVIELKQQQDSLTVDTQFTVPLGTELRYLKSCEFSSKAREISSTFDYREALSREVTETKTTGSTINLFIFKISNERKFSRSEQYKSFERSRAQAQRTTFESSALCTEFEAALQTFHNHSLQVSFQYGLASLTEWDKDNEEVVDAYRTFVDEFGTHYISKLLLGAKQIYTFKMSSRDVSTLFQEGISVASSLDAKSSFSFDLGKAVPGANLPGVAPPSPQALAGATVINMISNTNGESTSDSSNAKSNSNITEKLARIRETGVEISELSIGGSPPSNGDWKTWAASVRDNPMPITYELRALTELMDDEKAQWFSNAIEFIYKDGGVSDVADISKALAFGVSDYDGSPISTYTFDLNTGLRSSILLNRKENENSFFSYELTFEGSSESVSAVFVTQIRKSLLPNIQEDRNELLEVKSFPKQVAFPYSIDSSRATIAVYPTSLQEVDLNTFSYLSADSLPNITGITIGVVHPRGYIYNKVYGKDLGFSVSQENDNDFIIKFHSLFDKAPTLIVSPMLFPPNGNVSRLANEIEYETLTFGVQNCNETECNVRRGAMTPKNYINHAGFSFLAIDQKFDAGQNSDIQIVHGSVYVDRDEDNEMQISKSGIGFNITNYIEVKALEGIIIIGDLTVTNEIRFFESISGGVEIVFEKPFKEIPAVIATAVTGEFDIFLDTSESPELFQYQSPRIMVESLTEEKAFVKCFRVAKVKRQFGLGEYRWEEGWMPLSFNFVAVGPT